MFAAIVAAVVMTGAGPLASDQEKDAAAETYMTCLLKAAAKLDNGAAPEAQIATDVAASCSNDLQLMKDTFARGAASEVAQQISDQFDGLRRRSSERAVYIVRSRRGPPQGGS